MRERLTLVSYYEGTWALLLLFVTALSFAAGILPLASLVGMALLSLIDIARPSFRIHRFVLIGFGLLAVALGAYEYSSEKDVIWIFSGILAALLPFWVRRRRVLSGYWVGMVILVVFGLVALLAGDGASEFVLFIAFAATFVFSLNAAHLYFYVGSAEASIRKVPHHYFPPFVGYAALGLLVGGLLFVLFPRTLQWQNPLGMRSKESSTGFSGKISLGGVNISESQSIAMLIESDNTRWLEERAPFLLVKGNSLDYFDGVNWSSSRSKKVPYLSPKDVRFTSSFERRFFRLKIYRESSSAEAVFYPGVLQEASFPRSLAGTLQVDENGNLVRNSTGEERYAYNVTISPTRRPAALDQLSLKQMAALLKRPDKLRHSFSENAEDLRRFLQLPEGLEQAPYFRSWKKEIYEGKPLDRVGQVLLHLNHNFRNSFTTGYRTADKQVDSIKTFISDIRYGHCEFFATATVLMLRSMGVPSRVALGYRGGTFNPISQVLEVREANAHAWVEAYVPGVGWISMDPTPLIVRPKTVSWWESAQLSFAAIEFWFERYVVDYNMNTQARLFQEIRQSGWRERSTASHSSRRWLFGALALGAVLTAFFGWRQWSRRTQRRVRRLPSYYLEFARRVKALGYERKRGETFRQFHSRLTQSGRFSEIVVEVDAHLERDLYSAVPTNRTEQRRLSEMVRVLGLQA